MTIAETQRGTVANASLLEALRAIVGDDALLTDPSATRTYRTGWRHGGGTALAVVLPKSLVQMWRALEVCVDADTIVLFQAANTGLTGGSTPLTDGYDRQVVIINAMAVDGIHLLDGGKQVICLPGATLYQLEDVLAPHGREPHSVIGSSCIGASVIGGICNSSGGALVRRGPAYTELALYAQLDVDRTLRLVNHLGIALKGSPEDILHRLETGSFAADAVEHPKGRRASSTNYQDHVRDVGSEVPARFNADLRGLFEASGSAGRIALFAVRLDTFPKDERTTVFYIGTNDPGELTTLRSDILRNFKELPVAGEYLHRDCFDIAERYGKDTFLAIGLLGTKRLPWLFGLKSRFNEFVARIGLPLENGADRLLQHASRLIPNVLPRRVRRFRKRFEHHLILRVGGDGIKEAEAYLNTRFPSADGDFFRCTKSEGEKAFLHRFAAAGAAVRYRAVHQATVEGIIALDIALPRNASTWVETLPQDIASAISHRLYYGHFFCHVFHQDYIVRKGHDLLALEEKMCALLDARGAEYPAEHNVGHVYTAKPQLADFYRKLDPCNGFNPGIGRTSTKANWGSD